MNAAERQRVVDQERLILDVTETVYEHMQLRGVRKSDVAATLGVSRAYVTQALRGDSNLSLRTLADFAGALDCVVHVSFVSRRFNESEAILTEVVQLQPRAPRPIADEPLPSGATPNEIAV